MYVPGKLLPFGLLLSVCLRCSVFSFSGLPVTAFSAATTASAGTPAAGEIGFGNFCKALTEDLGEKDDYVSALKVYGPPIRISGSGQCSVFTMLYVLSKPRAGSCGMCSSYSHYSHPQGHVPFAPNGPAPYHGSPLAYTFSKLVCSCWIQKVRGASPLHSCGRYS
jgi:hypothetical protein